MQPAGTDHSGLQAAPAETFAPARSLTELQSDAHANEDEKWSPSLLAPPQD